MAIVLFRMGDKYDCLFNLILIGDSAVGKSCIVSRFIENKYPENTVCTAGVIFEVKYIQLEGKRIKLVLWDTAGPERYHTIIEPYFKRCHGIIVVYDVTDQESFDNVRMWLQLADRKASKDTNRLLIGHKCDYTTKRVVDYQTAKDFADQLGIPFFEVSSKDGTNVEQAFMTIVTEIKKRIRPPAPADDGRRHPRNHPPMNADEQGGIISSITGSICNYLGFANDTSAGKSSNDGRSNKYEATSGEGNKQVSKDKGIEILLDDLMQVFIDEQFSDAVLKVDGRQFNVHKVILAARSPVFATMFQHDMAEKNTNVVDIPDCTAESFEVFLHYLYSGSTEKLSVTNVFDVYYVADKYHNDYLKEKCLELMIQNISVETFCDSITLAVLHAESTLQKAAEDFFCQNMKKIIKTVQWQNFLAENCMMANELLIKALKD